METCKICKKSQNLEKHRIIPGLKYGGEYTKENTIKLCKLCHTELHNYLRSRRFRDNKLSKFEIVIVTEIYLNGFKNLIN